MRTTGLILAVLLLQACLSVTGLAQDQRRSGFETMGRELQLMQRDDLANPAMLSAAEGERLWNSVPPGSRSCQDCHGDASISMRGKAVAYPAIDETSGKPVRLSDRISQCRIERQGQADWSPESPKAIAMEAYLALQSRGQPIRATADPRLTPVIAEGRRIFTHRLGQLDLSCAQCHDDNAGQRLGGSMIPQGHPTGYPLYRLEWQATGTLARRIRNCLTGVRAQPFPVDAPEMIAIEVYLRERAAGLVSDAPAVRP